MPSFTFKLIDNRLPEGIRSTLANLLPTFGDKMIRMKIEEAKSQRSLDQNSYYRGVILPHVRKMQEENGDMRSLDKWHEVLLQEFAPTVQDKGIYGTFRGRAMRTHEMSVQEMNIFITAITAMCAEFHNPVPFNKENFYER